MAKNFGFHPDRELSQFFTQLLQEDDNKCYPQRDFQIDLQGYVTSSREVRGDYATRKLFTSVNRQVLQRDSYKAFIALLDNYESELGKPENVTDHEIHEMNDFINIIMKKKVMQSAHEFLARKRLAFSDVNQFKQMLYGMWFSLIRRTKGDRDYDSSSFEHVFVGETKQREIKGLHNWLQFYLQEKAGNIDYKGYFRRETVLTDQVPRLLTMQFTWKRDTQKPIGTIFLGSSPEFEIAVYTVCRLMNKRETYVQLGEYETKITCFPLGDGVGTAYIGTA